MCGISGRLSSGARLDGRLRDGAQHHRGPDDAGHYVDPLGRAELAFRRLSILDLTPAGHQPMPNEDESVWLVFNGEIYNHRELRLELERRGHRFRSRTDSEVLVHLWEDHGRGMLDRLNGMFAFCIWDERRGEAFLARDHAGIKPLYVADTRDGLAFASEAKVLMGIQGIDRSLDPIALRQFLTFLWVPGERTLWRGVRKVAAGGWLAWRAGQVEDGIWWDWDQSSPEHKPPEVWAGELRATLADTVERQLVSDVPVGALVSGGLDSSAIVGAMRAVRPGQRIRGYTARIDSRSLDGFALDLPYARAVQKHLDIDLVEVDVDPTLTSLLPLLIWHTDEPLADPAVAASYLLCRRARDDGTIVLLSGQGADELYHGYRSHRAMSLARLSGAVPRPLVRAATALGEGLTSRLGVSAEAAPRRLLKMLRFVGASSADRILSLADWGSAAVRDEILCPAFREAPADAVYGDYLALFDRARATTDEDRWSYLLFKTFMPALNLTYGDRTSMAASVELRVPFLDRELVEQAGRIPHALKRRHGRQKWILGEAARGWVPDAVRMRPKTGFGAPLREWLTGDLRGQVHDILLSDRLAARGVFDRRGLRRLLDDVERGRRDLAYVVWAVFTFELWAQAFVDGSGSTPASIAA